MLPCKTPYVSLDLWDTILRRRCHPDEVKLYTAQRMLHLLSPYLDGDYPGTLELLRRRQRIEVEIGDRVRAKGFDDEYEIEEVLNHCILDLTGKVLTEKDLLAFTEILVQSEIDQEITVTYLDDDLINLLQSCEYEKLLILSDFYMSADKVRKILQAHSFPYPVDTFFLSCDSKLNKRSGRLFKYVCSILHIEPGTLLHIGDNQLADVEMAEKSGVKTCHFVGAQGKAEREKEHAFFALRQKVETRSDMLLLRRDKESSLTFSVKGGEQEKLRRYGHYLSPLFTGFSLYIQELCVAKNHRTAHFFTREGKFFQKVFDRVQSHCLYSLKPIGSQLLPVSRLATFFPSLREITPKEMMRLWSQYDTQSVQSFLGSLGINPEGYFSIAIENGIDPEEMINLPWQDERFLRLFENGVFLDRLKEEHTLKRGNLVKFFRDCNFGHDGKAFVVDIGWRGTIQDNIALTFPDVRIDGCYFGLQRFLNPQPGNSHKFAYIADQNKGEFHEMLKYVMPFEMLCFGTKGSAVGYRQDSSGKMMPEFQYDFEEDRIHNERIRYFQEGVVEGVDNVCKLIKQHGISIQELQAEAKILGSKFLTTPPMVMCRAFGALKQDDTFGMARTIFPKESSFRFSDRMFAHWSSARKKKYLSDLEASGWPQCLIRSRYLGVFHKLGCLKRRLRRGGKRENKLTG